MTQQKFNTASRTPQMGEPQKSGNRQQQQQSSPDTPAFKKEKPVNHWEHPARNRPNIPIYGLD